MTLPRRPRSADRTRSPAAVSQKREYFKYPPETIGDFSLELAKFGVWRPTADSQKPAIGGHFCITEGKISWRRTGWLGREVSNPEMVNWKLRVPVPGLTSACSAKPSGVEATIKAYLTEIRNRLDKAAGIGRAADACASAGFHEKGLEVALDIEQLLYEATTLVNAASLINRIARQS
jgi:hypothetical protein